ncbi:unnamed protein product [Brassica napus]|uniref:(rape) hypothetical protein n=1 Tax=Brassica napus TaxID=3708 RepID=A0A816JVA0_BRANA|nr:unnamed protein product [Brassica napus]
MEENVTKRAKELTRSLSFTDLSDHEPVTVAGDNQIIGALNDMEIEDNQDDGMMECEGMDEDLLGIDLKDMEEREALQVVSKATSGHVTSGTDIKVLKSSRQGTKVNVPLGLQNKKFEILRRGSPRKPSSSSQGAHTARDSTRSRKHSQSSKKQRVQEALEKIITQHMQLSGARKLGKYRRSPRSTLKYWSSNDSCNTEDENDEGV